MKVRYIGKQYLGRAFEKDREYEVISIEKGWYRIMTELDEDYLFPPELFEVTEETDRGLRDEYDINALDLRKNLQPGEQ